MQPATLAPDLLRKMDAYWRAANDLSAGQIYLYDNPLLKRPLALTDVKPILLAQKLTESAGLDESLFTGLATPPRSSRPSHQSVMGRPPPSIKNGGGGHQPVTHRLMVA